MDNNSQLITYIVQELKRGVPEASIRSTLLQNGWPAEPVDRAFSLLQQSTTAPSVRAAELPAVPDGSAAEQPALPQGQHPGVARKTDNTHRPAKPRRSYRNPTLIVAGVVILAAVVWSILWAVNKPATPAERDFARKQALQTLAKDLTSYYKAKNTYPTWAQINSENFSASENGFDSANYTDPAWTTQNPCTREGKPLLSDARAKGCISYRSTARNGDDCNAGSVACTRAVLISTLESGEPYIIVLDRNKQSTN